MIWSMLGMVPAKIPLIVFDSFILCSFSAIIVLYFGGKGAVDFHKKLISRARFLDHCAFRIAKDTA